MTLDEANAYSDAVNGAVAAMENLKDVIKRQRAIIDLQYMDIGKLTRKVAERDAALARFESEADEYRAFIDSRGEWRNWLKWISPKFATEGGA